MLKSPIKKFGFYFSELLSTTIAYAILIWYFASKEYVFSSYNREISWLIVLLFAIGILMVLYHLIGLYREHSQISTVYERLESFKVAILRLLQNKQSLSSEIVSNNIRKTVDEHFAILEPSLIKTRIYRLTNMTLSGTAPDQDMLSNLLQQQEEVKGTRVRYISGILIMIGLLGTFLGLVQAVKYLQHFFTATESADLTTLFSDMKQTLGGLDKAFGTSIGGITAYLVLGYLNVVYRAKQSYILNQIEEISLEHLLPALQKFRDGKPPDVSTNAVEVLQALPSTLSKQVGTVLEDVVFRTIGGSADDLKTTTANLQRATTGIQNAQQTLAATLSSFGKFLTTFQDGTDRLIVSQETIASGIKEFSRALVKLEENQNMLSTNFEMTKNYIEGSENRLVAMDEIVREMHTIWTENRHIFETLSETIQHEHTTLNQTAQNLEEFLAMVKVEFLEYFQQAQQNIATLSGENTEINRQLLEAHTLLTRVLHDIKTFILDEQNGLRLLSTSMDETFGEARFQYFQLTDHLEELYKRIHENQEHLAHVQETATSIQQQLQNRHGH